MPNEPLYVYWDSCVFIDAIQRTPGRIETLEQIVDSAERGSVLIVTSMLSLSEVVKCDNENADERIKGLSEEQVEKLIVGFFENPYIRLRPIDRVICEKARELVRRCRIKPPDAIHVATAFLHPKITHVSTYDEPLTRKVSAVPVGITIGLPEWKGDMAFPAMIEEDPT